ncbi:tetratricopeptide repeat protein [Anthocerotibacter panamensis]|uniref:hypothetical protein n=1 Tax=Anthocerotibacter panamensis TaxID=2857077 RepID=UPI001C40397F|nr:hypothetical protein [Anthocerotibacter panamensis]
MRSKPSQGKAAPASLTPEETLQQQRYREALEAMQKSRRTRPDLQFATPEANIWLLQGQQEFQQGKIKRAENSFRQALTLGLKGETHYWLARCLLTEGVKGLNTALDLIRTAFVREELPKDYAVCYLKLLLLKHEYTMVRDLLTHQTKRFPAATLNWAWGVLDLQADSPETALAHLQKLKRPLTPGDSPSSWIAYTQQRLSDWAGAAKTLTLGSRKVVNHGLAPMRLLALQQAHTGSLDLGAPQPDSTVPREPLLVLNTVRLIEQGKFHDAGHTFLKLNRRSTRYPELANLYRPLMTLAGQQALTEGQPECAEEFWKPLVLDPPFHPQLVVNLCHALDEN